MTKKTVDSIVDKNCCKDADFFRFYPTLSLVGRGPDADVESTFPMFYPDAAQLKEHEPR
eukprot:CAMPEP_0113858104 /NCGR_PEP_ID=MMETSP0372-20130328/10923_1 /TAXON_ID=340204 /ORGANISM="Lankesteria abbotti" /LENGTH=58 /DNA_ID=CAMNT_0000834813 /DNA_START=20 /DNA_END=192 /DNA_ORIENTATION=- /assembly_acc=CAM_ASM_000359